jgi:FlaA1/EpsC-like NDP-sugar epimerase
VKRLKFIFSLRSRTAALSHDLLAIPLAWFAAYWLRFNLETIPPAFFQTALNILPVIVAVQGVVFIIFGLYRGVWRFASIPDLVRIVKAVFFGVLASLALIFLLTRMQHVPRSVIPLYSLLLFSILAGNRLIYRWLKDYPTHKYGGKRVLIVGAGEAAELLVRDMLRHRDKHFVPVAFVDDGQNKIGRELHGIRVVGNTGEIPVLVQKLKIDLVLIAIPSLTSEKMRRIVEMCERSNIPFRTLPKFEDLVSGQVSTTALREVSIEDLLGREKVELDWNLIHSGLSGKTVMVSGGGGSIGSELCRQIANLAPASLIIFERSEFNLYRIVKDLGNSFPQMQPIGVLGDVCDRQAVENTLKKYSPNIIFHAAAYKQVPILQNHPREAVRNNVFGTIVLSEAADRYDCEKFVFISTDKAVNPTNILGYSKRLAELYCQSMDQTSKTRFISVRFGNVLGSDGSVVQLFREQISQGGPVTITHPEITRYFMTIREACQLILQVAVIDGQGDVFVLDMGEPVKISYLAEQMILLSGREPGVDIDIKYIGLRPGEKLHEELFYSNEIDEKTANEKILRARHNSVRIDKLNETINLLKDGVEDYDDDKIQLILAEAVPLIAELPSTQDNVIHLTK